MSSHEYGEHARAKPVAKTGAEHNRMATYVIGFSRVNGRLRVAEFGWQLSYSTICAVPSPPPLVLQLVPALYLMTCPGPSVLSPNTGHESRVGAATCSLKPSPPDF